MPVATNEAKISSILTLWTKRVLTFLGGFSRLSLVSNQFKIFYLSPSLLDTRYGVAERMNTHKFKN